MPLFAQGAPGEDLSDFQSTLEQPVEVASKRIQRLKEAPADISVLRGQDLQELGYRTLAEALGGVLGFRTNQDRSYAGLGVRGLYVLGDQNTRVLVLLDGHPLNNPAEVGSGKIGEDFGIPMDLVERIEIIRGPASSIYGNNAFLGMVNVVTREPGSRPAAGTIMATGSSRGLADLDGVVGGTVAGLRWQALVSGMQREGSPTQFPELGPQTLPASLDREERQSAYLRAAGTDWSFAGFSGRRIQHLASAPFNATIGSGVNEYENRQNFGDLRLTPEIGALSTLLRLYGDYNEFRSELDYDGTRQSGVQGRYFESDPDWSLGLEAQVRAPLGDSFLATLGQELAWHHYDSWAGIAPDITTVGVRYRLGSSYLQTEWKPSDSFSATGGLQVSLYSVASASEANAPQGSANYPEKTWTGTTPRLVLIWQPTAVDILKTIYGEGYRNPTLFESYYSDGSSFVPNPGLEPERISTLEALWVRNWSTGLESQFTVSRSRWRHLVDSLDLGGGFEQFQNDPDTLEGYALEAELQGRWGYWVGYAQVGWYRWEQAGRPFPNVARMQGALRLTRRWNRFSASAEVRQVGTREGGPGVAGVPAATTFRLAVRLQAERFWIRGTVEDAGQGRETDLVASDYSPITRMPGDGRTVYLSLGFPF
jgi:iron complex outermembrane receptor protein